MDYVTLGKTGIRISPLGFGTLTMGFSQRALSHEAGAALIVYAVERGINFFDTAQYYDTYPYLRLALDEIRSKNLEIPVIASKSLATDHKGMRLAVEEALTALNLPSLPIFLLHEVWGREDFESRRGAWEALMECKEEGLVKAIGLSTHHVDAVEKASTVEEMDVVFPLLNVNSLGIRKEDGPGTKEEMEKAISLCHRANIGVFTMKAFGGGNLTADYVKCLDYATSVPGNSAVMIGLSSVEEIDRALDYYEGRLSPSYRPDVSKKRMVVEQSDCVGCGSCIKRCAGNAISWNQSGLAEIDQTLCLRCGYCGPVCPVRAIILL